MKKLLILSGKGGTGKTTVASAFIKLSDAKAFADCDVDAPNLHLVLKQNEAPKKSDYIGMGKAQIDTHNCSNCGVCKDNCRFDAIKFENGNYLVNKFYCEGCGVCEAICPQNAIRLFPDVAGELMLYNNDDIVFSTAELKMGSGTSGKLVSEVKKQLFDSIKDYEIAIIDGSPGIGCPVIASISGVDMVLVVAEPSISGINDMERIIKTAQKFQTKVIVCINKFDTNIENVEKIESFCINENIPVVGKIPFDKNVVTAINNNHSIIDINCPANTALQDVYKKTIDILLEKCR